MLAYVAHQQLWVWRGVRAKVTGEGLSRVVSPQVQVQALLLDAGQTFNDDEWKKERTSILSAYCYSVCVRVCVHVSTVVADQYPLNDRKTRKR